jgi:hypothetical protein
MILQICETIWALCFVTIMINVYINIKYEVDDLSKTLVRRV